MGCHCREMTLILKTATLDASLLHLAKAVAVVQGAFSTQYCKEPPRRFHFWGCLGSKPEHGPLSHQAQKVEPSPWFRKCTTSARMSCARRKRILGCALPHHIVCKMPAVRQMRNRLTLLPCGQWQIWWHLVAAVSNNDGPVHLKHLWEFHYWLTLILNSCINEFAFCTILNMSSPFVAAL
jgi:hypothetical protein